jgi:hypothetical protein
VATRQPHALVYRGREPPSRNRFAPAAAGSRVSTSGLSVAEARRQARLSLGGVERTRELHRQARSFAWIDDMRRDLYYAARILAGNVEFTLAVVLTIGLGIGGTTAVFGLINARLFSGPRMRARTTYDDDPTFCPPTVVVLPP